MSSTDLNIRFMNESHYMFVYWILGTFFDDIETLTLGVGIVRSFESVGSALSYGVGAVKTRPMVNLIISFAMFGVTIPSTTFATFLVPERPIDETKLGSDIDSLEGEIAPATIAKAAEAADGPHA